MTGTVSTTKTAAGTLHCEVWEPPAQARGTVLLLHGAESHAGWFLSFAKRLAEGGWRAVAYDRAGWGQSPGPRGRLAAPPLAELKGAAERLGQNGPVHLIGMSWGGLLAACARAELPHLFASVTLLAPALYPKKRPSLWALARAGRHGLVRLPLVPGDFTANPERQAYIAGDPHRVVAVSRDFCLTTHKMARQARASFLRAGGPPTLVLLAAADRVIDSAKTRALTLARGGRVEVLSGAAHSLVFEDPAAVAKLVAAHLAQAASDPDKARPHAS